MTAPLPRLGRRGVIGLALSLPLPLWAAPRPRGWAVALTVPGLSNLHRVGPGLYRAAQPDTPGFAALPALGITTVLSLRQLVDDAPLAEGTDLTLHRLPMKSRDVGEGDSAKLVAALRIIRQSQGPILVHCRHGADRTGAVCALYRMLFQGWSRDEALAELMQGGFGFHPVWQNIPRYLIACDPASLKSRVLA